MTHDLLLISESEVQAQRLRRVLRAHAFQVFRQPQGLTLQMWIRARRPALILLSVDPDVIRSTDICRQLREMGVRQPILALARCSDEVDHVLALEGGADDYLEEGMSPRLLAARLRAHLRREAARQSAIGQCVEAGDLVIDLQRGQALRNQTPLPLSPTEYRLLACLARHRGQVLSRAQIASQLWTEGGEVRSDAVVNVHVCRLRRKIEDAPPARSTIQTVPGLGYRLA